MDFVYFKIRKKNSFFQVPLFSIKQAQFQVRVIEQRLNFSIS